MRLYLPRLREAVPPPLDDALEDMAETAKQMGDLASKLPEFKTIESGAATSVWAATSPLLDGRSFAYCEDCDVAVAIDEPNFGYGVLPHATSPESAEKLWHKAAQLIGRPLPLL